MSTYAMILAAGRGKRMLPLTEQTPKPLLSLAGSALIVHHIKALAQSGIKDIVINLHHLAENIKMALGNGENWGVKLHYSLEPDLLETGGGIFQALPLLGHQPFIVVSADIWTDYNFSQLQKPLKGMAHLVLVDNPPHHPLGDFVLKGEDIIEQDGPKLNFGNIGLYSPQLFHGCSPGHFPLGPLLRRTIQAQQVTGEHFTGRWHNIGTALQLKGLQQQYGD